MASGTIEAARRPAPTREGRALPVLAVVAAIVLLWYGFAVVLNAPWARDQAGRDGRTLGMSELVLDTLSPYLATITLSAHYPYVLSTSDSPLRIVALCLSGASRAVCGAVAGGSKAALTVHFASAGERPGDVGDLSAKDGSKETVLALLGMLVRLCPSELPASAGARC